MSYALSPSAMRQDLLFMALLLANAAAWAQPFALSVRFRSVVDTVSDLPISVHQENENLTAVSAENQFANSVRCSSEAN